MSSNLDEPVAVGVDGCKGGWIAALCCRRPGDEYATSLKKFGDIVQLANWRDGFAGEPPVTIDVPIGIPEVVRYRRCDEEARDLLGPMRNAVFMPPGRYLLTASNYGEVRQLVEERRQEEASARGLSVQAFGILPKIREVDEFVRGRADSQEWLFEVHPELCFRAWAGRDLPPKRSAAGTLERLVLVRDMFSDAESVIRGQRSRRSQDANITDVLDAYAALWAALRKTQSEHQSLTQETLGGTVARMIY